MAHIGKIARLPKDVRDVINKRLLDGHPAQDIADWLNEQPVVQAVLEKEFDGEPINHTNMHWWAKGGYLDWKRASEHTAPRGGGLAFLLNQLNLLKRAASPEVADDIALLFATSLGAECVRLDGIEDRDERVKALNELLDGFAQWRGAELDGGKRSLDRQKLADLKEAAEKRQKEAMPTRKPTPEETQAAIRRILGTG